MRLTKSELVALIETGDYHVVMKKNDWNRDDIFINREDGTPADIQNFPYRINQMPTYLFDELVRNNTLIESGLDDQGGTIFRLSAKKTRGIVRAA